MKMKTAYEMDDAVDVVVCQHLASICKAISPIGHAQICHALSHRWMLAFAGAVRQTFLDCDGYDSAVQQ